MPRKGWGSARKEAYRGRVYDSHSEAEYARHLDRLQKSKQIVSWQPQVKIDLVVEGTKVCAMVPDFEVTRNDFRVAYVEVKGFATPVWRLKRKLFEALHPDRPYIVIKAKDVLNGTATEGVPTEAAGARRRRVARRPLRQRVRR